ncbi:MAG: hypothetical protein AB1797_11785 [bacterium]
MGHSFIVTVHHMDAGCSMLDAGCLMLEAGKGSRIQYRVSSIEDRASRLCLCASG